MASPCIVTDQGVKVFPEWWGWNAVVNSLPRGWTYYADCPSASPAPPPAPTPTDPYFTVGLAAINTTPLTPFDRTNATYSLYATDPNLSPATRDLYGGLVDSNFAHITAGLDGQPNLIIPPTSPSTGAPCPQGFVAQTPEVVTERLLTERIGGQLEAIRTVEAIAPSACKPLPTVTAIGTWVTANDCLAASVYTNKLTSGLTLSARILDCDGQLHYMTYSLDGAPVGVRTTITLPLTPGYLLDVAVSDIGADLPAGSTFVTVALQHTCAAGVPPNNILGAGYVTGTYGVSWPNQPSGAPYQAPLSRPGPGAAALIQHKAGVSNSGQKVDVALDLSVTAGDALVAFAMPGTGGYGDVVSDDQGNVWTLVERFTYPALWVCASAKTGFTTVTFDVGAGANINTLLVVFEIAGLDSSNLVDVFAHGGGAPPVTVTTSSTSLSDVGVCLVSGLAASGSGFTTPAGWTKEDDITSANGTRLIALWNGSVSTPTAPWSVTEDLNGSSNYVILAALHVAAA